MRIPHVHKLQYESAEKQPEETIEVHIDPQAYIDDIGLFDDKKEYVQWIIRMKKLVRNSGRYVEMMSFLKRRRGMNRCGIHPHMTGWNGNRIEIHHTPFVMEDIVSIVTKKRLDRNESMKMSDIAKEIMELHYLGLVGLYSLCTLCHTTIHSDDVDIFIPLDCVFGDPAQFVDIYKPYMTEALYAKWANIVVLNKGYTMIQQNLPLEIQKKYIYVQNTAVEDHVVDVVSTDKLAKFLRDL